MLPLLEHQRRFFSRADAGHFAWLCRLVLHYQYGLPRLGGWRPFAALMDAAERGLRAVWPRSRWAYIVAVLRSPAAPAAGAPRAPSP